LFFWQRFILQTEVYLESLKKRWKQQEETFASQKIVYNSLLRHFKWLTLFFLYLV